MAQFEWWKGVVAICSMAIPESCWTLVTRGVFDGAMAPQHEQRGSGISDLTSTVEYCQWMLRPGGLCDTALPVSHAAYHSTRQHICGATVLAEGQRYTNPHDSGDVAFALEVSYKNVDMYEMVHSYSFRFFLTLIVLMWFVNLVDEAKDILNLADFVRNFPVRSFRDTVRYTAVNALSRGESLISSNMVSHFHSYLHGESAGSGSAEGQEVEADVEAVVDDQNR